MPAAGDGAPASRFGHRPDHRAFASVTARLVTGLRMAVLAGGALCLIGVAGTFAGIPMLTATLGPTAYLLFVQPGPRWDRLRGAAVGHAVAIVAGLAGLAAAGRWHIESAYLFRANTISEAFAVAIALAITLLVLHLLRAHHPPAASTTVLVASGLAGPGRLLLGLVLGLAALFLLQLALNEIPDPSTGS